jgi:hypothetical protein
VSHAFATAHAVAVAQLDDMTVALPDRSTNVALDEALDATFRQATLATPPGQTIVPIVFAPLAPSMSLTRTIAPSGAKRRAVTRPMPDPAPVTIATMPNESARQSQRRSYVTPAVSESHTPGMAPSERS